MARTFDRTADVAKIVGCNTRNVEYRWNTFLRHLPAQGAAVMDFGAGSLRESHELCGRGYAVTACDLDADTLAGYAADYDWHGNAPTLAGGIAEGPFDLITAFDVFEHLDRPEATLAAMRERLAPGGMIFATVPNALTAFEIVGRIHYKIGLATHRTMTPGEPHIQFKTPGGWHRYFEAHGFEVIEHDMAIGFLVNTWAAAVQTVTLALRKAVGRRGDRSTAGVLGRVAGPRVMATLDRLDRAAAWATRGLSGWNLFVLRAGLLPGEASVPGTPAPVRIQPSVDPTAAAELAI